jgi:hypothetical protein
MPLELEYDVGVVAPFLQAHVPGFSPSGDLRAIGVVRHGAMVAAVGYEGINGRNAWMHVAALPGSRWLTRHHLKAFFWYPFITCGCDRVSAYVNENNAHARQFDERIGFQEEARLKGAAWDGGDVILYVMWKKDCPYV